MTEIVDKGLAKGRIGTLALLPQVMEAVARFVTED